MNAASATRQLGRTFAIGVATCLLVAGATAAVRGKAPKSVQYVTPIGDELPELALQTLDGRTVTLRERLGGRPALIYVFGTAECASCSNLPLEFKIVHNETPGLQTLLIGSGAGVEAFRPSIKEMGLDSSAVIDENQALIHALGLQHEPAVLLTDSTGHILLVDTRGASRAAQYPMGRIIHDISAVLGQTRAPQKS